MPERLPKLDDESGFGLIEILMAMAVMSIALVALIAAMGTSVLGASVHRTQAVAELEVRRYAELVSAAPYSDAGYTAAGVGYTPPSTPPFSFTADAPTMTCLSSLGATVACPGAQVQVITVGVRSADGHAQESIEIVKRTA